MEKEAYRPSEAVQAAAAAVQEQKKKKPSDYRSGWEERLAEVMERILSREDFRYSLNGDALYRQLRDQARANGQLAMEDTMGQAAAMTGGYGNSYAQSAGQQAYARQMENLSDRIPALYQLALEQYRQQTQGLYDRYELLTGAEDRDYSRYRDALEAWQKEADDLQQSYRDSLNFDYGAYRDDVADRQWQTEFDEDLRRYERDWADKHPTVTSKPTYTTTTKKKEEEKDKTQSAASGPKVVLL